MPQRKRSGLVAILDIAVPRDFDPAIHDGESTCLFNIDDGNAFRDATLANSLRRRFDTAIEYLSRPTTALCGPQERVAP